MKSVLRTLRLQPCREQPITENEKSTFSTFQHLQRYHSAVDHFTVPEETRHHAHLALPSKYWIDSWLSSKEDRPKVWNCKRTSQEGIVEDCDSFVKVVHLLDPINMMKEKYVTPAHPLLPQSEKIWKDTLLKLHNPNNQAYVDNVANFILSRFRELNRTPHCVLYYGCSTGISQSYQFNISNEFYTYRQCRWFWKGMKIHGATLHVSKPDTDGEDTQDVSNFDEIYKEITTCPFENLEEDSDSEIELERIVSEDSVIDVSDVQSVHSVTFDEIEEEHTEPNEISHIPEFLEWILKISIFIYKWVKILSTKSIQCSGNHLF